MSFIMRTSPLSDIISPCGLIFNDAGSANIMLSWLMGEAKNYPIYASGPALRLLKSEIYRDLNVTTVHSIESLVEQVEVVITGTGWQSASEITGIHLAKKLGKPCIAILDHWVNYKDRFFVNGKLVLPNEIWVTDEWAFELASSEFPSTPIKLKKNFYAEAIIEKIGSFDPVNNRLLYLGEPIRKIKDSILNPEMKAYQYFVENAPLLDLDLESMDIHIRAHPSQEPDFYTGWKSRYPQLHFPSQHQPLERAIGEASVVVGMNSFGLFLAAQARKKTISAVPIWAPSCTVPHKEIISI